ncbi:hypothetical protein PE143B_0101440 [Pseudomonas extremaustralis 14-3 substr. 14-3b]|nr:hypothetical protein PE143B_0101440 [Pseudomonas extremaustralis 14-3 substr. 14-3b]
MKAWELYGQLHAAFMALDQMILISVPNMLRGLLSGCIQHAICLAGLSDSSDGWRSCYVIEQFTGEGRYLHRTFPRGRYLLRIDTALAC